MAFGGYKFAGYRVDNTQYSTSIERCLAIHAARVRSFLNASNAAGNPWAVDQEWSIGTIDLNVTTGVISTGTNCIIIEQIGYDGNVHGYLTCFKYSNGGVNGYYAILTTDDYYIGSGDTGINGLILNQESCLHSKDSNNLILGPIYASCLHCLSLEPFGHAPSGEEGKDCYYLIDKDTSSTRIKSIGYNFTTTNLPSYSYISGYVSNSTDISHFGYAIKDKDIIVFSAISAKTSYTNPFIGTSNTHVTVMSLEGFSELYSKDDTYKFLEFEVCNNYYTSSGTYDETKCNGLQGNHHQLLDATGKAMIDNTFGYNSIPRARVSLDVRAYYDPSGANYTPFMGLPVFLSNEDLGTYISGTQYYKGTTNPELISTNFSRSALVYTPYSNVINGNVMYLGYVNSASSAMPVWYPRSSSWDSFSSSGFLTGYYNVYIGWDSDNPDIKTDAAWTEYNPTVGSLVD